MHFSLRIFFIICGIILAIQIPLGIYNWLIEPNNNNINFERIKKIDDLQLNNEKNHLSLSAF